MTTLLSTAEPFYPLEVSIPASRRALADRQGEATGPLGASARTSLELLGRSALNVPLGVLGCRHETFARGEHP